MLVAPWVEIKADLFPRPARALPFGKDPTMIRPGRKRPGLSLIELMVALVIMGVLISYSTPTFSRAVEQSKADVAAANLRQIWSAQRLFRLDNLAYAADLATLTGSSQTGMPIYLDPSLTTTSGTPAPPYTFTIELIDAQTFSVTATRAGGSWSGSFAIDQNGTVTGSLTKSGETSITPGFL